MKGAHRHEGKVKAAGLVDGASDGRAQKLGKVHGESGQAENGAHGILKLHGGVGEGGRDDEGVSSGVNCSYRHSTNDKVGTRRKEFQKSAIRGGLKNEESLEYTVV